MDTMHHHSMADMEVDVRRRFFVALLLTIPVILYSDLGVKLGLVLPSPIPTPILLWLFTTPIVFWPGSLFIVGAYKSLRAWQLNMSVLIATGVLTAYCFSVLMIFMGGEETFFDASAMLVTFVLFGHWMEMKSRRGTSDALRALFDLVPPQATVLRNNREQLIPVAELVKGDIVVIKPGDKIPVDGEIIAGETTIDESMVTGESMPVDKQVGDSVIGGSVNKMGALQFRVTRVGKETALAQIITLVQKAQESKAPGQRLADRAAAYLVAIAIGSGVITFLAWYFGAHASLMTSLTFALSAVVIACPDALGLATPTAVAVGTGIGARHHILIKDALTLEETSKIQTILLDKTGTLTEGKPVVSDIIPLAGIGEKELLAIAGAVQQFSEHPLSKAFVQEMQQRKIVISQDVVQFHAVAGHGIRAVVGGKQVLIGTYRFLQEANIDAKDALVQADLLMRAGKTISFIATDERVVGIIGFVDAIKPTARKAVDGLKNLGIEVIMVTGDHALVAQRVGKELGITRIFAPVLPEEKLDVVIKVQRERRFVAMVGDGINDAPALAKADVGIAIGAGTDVARETADIILMRSDPADILIAIQLSRATVRKMKENLVWATVYNLLAIPVAAGVFYSSFGIKLSPEFAALLMSISSVIVATNAVLLRRIEKTFK